jgi:addiction module RelE/StbE family toxin
MQVKFSRKFSKQYDKAQENIRASFDERLKLFLHAQFHPLLKNHPLTGQWRGFRSINITGDWRAVFEERERDAVIYFVTIGTHSQLYS